MELKLNKLLNYNPWLTQTLEGYLLFSMTLKKSFKTTPNP
jgi:hypothetical protein